MNTPTVHECPDGAKFRVSQVQAIRKQILFYGESFVFQVEPEDETSAGAFEMRVHYAPIYLNIASPVERLKTDDRALDLARRALDAGYRQATEIQVTSDGAAKVGDRILTRLYPIDKTA